MTAKEFKEIRKKLRFSQAEMAEKLKLDQSTISAYETGRRPIMGTVAELLKRIYEEAVSIPATCICRETRTAHHVH